MLIEFVDLYHFRCVKKVRGGLFPKGRKSVSHCRDTAVRLLIEFPTAPGDPLDQSRCPSLPVPECIEGTGSVPRGVEFCVASFGKETPTDQLVVIGSIRTLNSYEDFDIWGCPIMGWCSRQVSQSALLSCFSLPAERSSDQQSSARENLPGLNWILTSSCPF